MTITPAGTATQALAAMARALPVRVTGSRAELVAMLAEAETLVRSIQGLQYQAIAEAEIVSDDTLGRRRVTDAVADSLRISPADARARRRTAAQVCERVNLQGEVLSAGWPSIAKLVTAGVIGEGHLKVVRTFFRDVPAKTDPLILAAAAAELAEYAAVFRPDEMEKLAHALLNVINPDGTLDDERDRARKRHFTMGKQGSDKMTSGRFCLEPAAAAALEALFAKFARRGIANPEDVDPVVDGDPSPEAIASDSRTYVQRCHDAVVMFARNTLTDENIGQHRGLPATIVITADIKDLDPETRATSGLGRTGGGLLMPIADVLRLGRHARNYLAVFEHGKPIGLFEGRARRLATAGQRLVLFASNRGCTFPSCDRGAYYAQVHHSNRDWNDGGLTNIDDEALACDLHHPLAGPGPHQWKTRTTNGVTVWIPPKIVDPEQKPRINLYHHPERRLLRRVREDRRRRR